MIISINQEKKDTCSSRNVDRGYCFGMLVEPPNPFSLPSIVIDI